eukprot:6188095-Pleurochrysis_carterae.AAC.6
MLVCGDLEPRARTELQPKAHAISLNGSWYVLVPSSGTSASRLQALSTHFAKLPQLVPESSVDGIYQEHHYNKCPPLYLSVSKAVTLKTL